MKSIGDLKGKNCIFFGANGSIGRELCKNLAKIHLNLGLVNLSPRDSTRALRTHTSHIDWYSLSLTPKPKNN